VTQPGAAVLSRPTSCVQFLINALTQGRTHIAEDPFYRESLCGASQGRRGRMLERLYTYNCLPLTVELFRQLAFSF
jgi:hypothetical protein